MLRPWRPGERRRRTASTGAPVHKNAAAHHKPDDQRQKSHHGQTEEGRSPDAILREEVRSDRRRGSRNRTPSRPADELRKLSAVPTVENNRVASTGPRRSDRMRLANNAPAPASVRSPSLSAQPQAPGSVAPATAELAGIRPEWARATWFGSNSPFCRCRAADARSARAHCQPRGRRGRDDAARRCERFPHVATPFSVPAPESRGKTGHAASRSSAGPSLWPPARRRRALLPPPRRRQCPWPGPTTRRQRFNAPPPRRARYIDLTPREPTRQGWREGRPPTRSWRARMRSRQAGTKRNDGEERSVNQPTENAAKSG